MNDVRPTKKQSTNTKPIEKKSNAMADGDRDGIASTTTTTRNLDNKREKCNDNPSGQEPTKSSHDGNEKDMDMSSSLLDEESSLSSLRRSSSTITFSLTAAAAAEGNIQSSNDFSTSTLDKRTKLERLRKEWEATCQKWGFVVVRQLTYEQSTFSADAQSDKGNVKNQHQRNEEDSSLNRKELQNHSSPSFGTSTSSSAQSSVIYVNGAEARQIKDELLVSKVFRPSVAHSAGLLEGDRINAVYGMLGPNLKLLFGIMKNSNTFEITVNRQETPYERRLRTCTDSKSMQNNHDKDKFEQSGKPMRTDTDRLEDNENEMEYQSKNQEGKKASHLSQMIVESRVEQQRDEIIVPDKESTDMRSQEHQPIRTDDDIISTTILPADEMDDNQFDEINFDEVDFAAIDAAVANRQKQKNIDFANAKQIHQQQENSQEDLKSPCADSKLTQTHTEENESESKVVSESTKAVNNMVTDALEYSEDDSLHEELFGASPQSEEHEHESTSVNESVDPMHNHPQHQPRESDNIPATCDTPQYSDSEALHKELFGSSSDEGGCDEKDTSEATFETHPETIAVQTYPQHQESKGHTDLSLNRSSTDVTNGNQITGCEDLSISILEQKNQEESREEISTDAVEEMLLDHDAVESNIQHEGSAQRPELDESARSMKSNCFAQDERGLKLNQSNGGQHEIMHDSASASIINISNSSDSTKPHGKIAEQNQASNMVEDTEPQRNSQYNPNHSVDSSSSMNDEDLLNDKELHDAEKQLMTMIEQSLEQTQTETTTSDKAVRKKEKSKKRRKLSEDSSRSTSSKRNSKADKKSKKSRRKLSESSVEKSSEGDECLSTERKRKRDLTGDITKKTCVGRPPIHSVPGASKAKEIQISVPRPETSFSLESSPSPSISRGSPSAVSRQKDSTAVCSTSSKAGLSQIKNTKLKRLWPDSSVFIKRVMKWCPPKVIHDDYGVFFKGSAYSGQGGSQDLPVIPSNFRDTSELIKFMSPHILEEGLLSIKQEFNNNSDKNGIWRRDSISLNLRSCTPVDPRPATSAPSLRTFEFAFSLNKNNTTQPARNLGEIFVLYSPSWKNQQCCIGIIGSNDVNSTFLSDQKLDREDSYDLFKLWVCVCSEPKEETGWLSGADMPPKNPDGSFAAQTMYVLNIGTCTDMMRQYEGLKSLACVRPHLKRAIYHIPIEGEETGDKRGDVLDTEPMQTPSKPPSVVANVWTHLERTTNAFQLSAIEKIMAGKMKENIALLQGPPGTGKTMTTVALVSALLNGAAPVSGSKSQGTRVQVGRAFSSNAGPVMNANVTRRILVCAPSNQAVDELAWKIHKNALGPNGKPASFNMIRFGLLPGDDRHDGRGKRSTRKEKKFHDNEKDKFLHAINLDNLVRDIAGGREVHDFAFHDKKSSQHSNKGRKSRHINYNNERQKILSQCHVICTTLSGAGSKAFIEAVSRDQFPQSEFDAVIIDEACQGSEMSCLIPFKYNPNVICLVGDPSQLPVMTFSQHASRCCADRSLFDRLHSNGWPINMLRIQYRMNPEIVEFPSKTFYASSLITCAKVMNRRPMMWHDHIAFPPYLVWNLQGGSMSRGANGGVSNNVEANFVVNLLQTFSDLYGHVRNIDIGVISFYNDQVLRIKEKVESRNILKRLNSNNNTLQISTVDGFQGSEKDIIILSCVRSRWHGKNARASVGFLKDFRRVNVALTRAKHSLWVVANCNILRRDALWNELILDASKRNLIAETSILPVAHNHQKKPSKKKKKKKKSKNKAKQET